MISMRTLLGIAAAVSCTSLMAASLTGCRDEGYLFYSNQKPSKSFDHAHKLKQLQGNSVVDIVWVIDNSASMMDAQRNVMVNTQIFMDEFTKKGNLQWKMGLISTDKSEAPYIGFGSGRELNHQTPNGVQLFQSAVSQLGLNGTYLEEGFDPLLGAFRRYPDFVRSNSVLAVIFVTDAQEQGEEAVTDVLASLGQIKQLRDVVSYGIFNATDLNCDNNGGEEEWRVFGSRYGEFIQSTSGKAYPLCAPDFGMQLSDLGKDLVSRVSSPKLFLDARPLLSTLKVFHGGVEVPGGPRSSGGYWYYNVQMNAIVFHDLSFAPGDDEEVQVVFDEDTGVAQSI